MSFEPEVAVAAVSSPSERKRAGERVTAPSSLFLRLALGWVFVLLVISPPLHALKLIRWSADAGAWLFYITLPLLTLLFAGVIVENRPTRILVPDAIEVGLLLTAAVAALTTLYYGGDATDIAGNILRLAFSYLCYQAIRRHAKTRELIAYIAPRFIRLGAVGIFVGLLVVYGALIMGRPVYIGMNTEFVFPALFAALVVHGFASLQTSLGVLAVLLGGKRGAILALIVTLLAYLALLRRRHLAIAGFLLLGVVIVGVSASDGVKVVQMLPPALGRRFLPFLLQGGEAFDVRSATAGRNVEWEQVFEVWKRKPSLLLTGGGLGATIRSEDGSGTDSTIHVSPIALAYLFGLPCALFLMVPMFSLPIRLLLHSKRQGDRESLYWGLLTLALLLTTMSVFAILQNPLLWIAMGIASALERPEARAMPRSVNG